MEFQIGQVKIIIKGSGSSVIFPAGNYEIIANYQPGKTTDENVNHQFCVFITERPKS